MITMKLTREISHGAPERMKLAMRRWSMEIGPVAEAAVKEKAPVYKGGGSGNHFGGHPGYLRDSIHHHMTGRYGVEIQVGAPYAKYVIGGTHAHSIDPRRASVLYWLDGNEAYFAPHVNHPGNKPNNFPEKALAPWGPIFASRLRELMAEATKG